jgi:predicted PurR-regulated permease PerM
MNVSFQRLFFSIATVIALFAALILAKSVLIPISFALIVSFILLPLAKKFELWGMSRIIGALFSIVTMILIISGGIYLFSTQIIGLSEEFGQFQDRIISAFSDATVYLNRNVNILPNLEPNELPDRIKGWLSDSTGLLVGKTFSTTATLLTGLVGTIIFTFLIMIYREGLTQAFISFSPEANRERVYKMLKSVQQVGKKYLFGMIILIVIIGIANSIGLMIIGIDNPILFGFLGSVLSIIPYVGTTFGAIIPMLYAFVSSDRLWPVFAVALLFWCVQLITDNFLSPKIVGGSLNINALAAILSLIIGALVWGVAGMILFLPFTAMLKIICEEYEELRPIAMLIGTQNIREEQEQKSASKNIEKMKGWVSKIKTAPKKKQPEKPSAKTEKTPSKTS